jgi:hypothetical protein
MTIYLILFELSIYFRQMNIIFINFFMNRKMEDQNNSKVKLLSNWIKKQALFQLTGFAVNAFEDTLFGVGR